MKKVVISIIVLALAFAGIFFILEKNKAKNEAQTAEVAVKNAAVAVRAAKAEYKEMESNYVNNGVFAPKQEVMISAETPGLVQSVLVKEGSYVSAGQTLAVIKADKQNVNVANAKAVLDNAESEVQRFENAYASGGVTKQQLDQIKLQLVNARNNYKSAQLTAGDVNVKASFSGIVNKKNIEPGSYVNPGQQLFEVVNVGSLKLKVNVDEKSVATLKIGDEVAVYATVVPDMTFKGNVTFIAPKAEGSLNFPVEIEIKNNTNNVLKAGMYGTAQFGGNNTTKALVIPRTAFVGNVSSNQVYVITDNKAILTNVVVGRNFGEYVEIVSGLDENSTVVTTGQINLDNETPVEVIN